MSKKGVSKEPKKKQKRAMLSHNSMKSEWDLLHIQSLTDSSYWMNGSFVFSQRATNSRIYEQVSVSVFCYFSDFFESLTYLDKIVNRLDQIRQDMPLFLKIATLIDYNRLKPTFFEMPNHTDKDTRVSTRSNELDLANSLICDLSFLWRPVF